MKQIIVELTENEHKAFEYVALSPEEWADNCINNDIRRFIDATCNKLLPKITNKFANSIGLPKIIRDSKTLPKEKKGQILKKKIKDLKGKTGLNDTDLKIIDILTTDYKLTETEAKKFLKLYNRTKVLEKMIKDRANIAIGEVVDKAFNPKDETVMIAEKDLPQDLPRVVNSVKSLSKEIKEQIVSKATLKTAKQRNEEAKE